MTTEEKTAAGEAATRAGQGDDGEKRADSSHSVNTECVACPCRTREKTPPEAEVKAPQEGAPLLKCLCQTEEEKTVAWHSDARSLERHGVPREFTTKSRVVIIANDWNR